MVVYLLKNKINNKCYIGKTTKELDVRINGHIYTSRQGTSHLSKAIRKYGFESFEISVLEDSICTEELLNHQEIYWICLYDSFNTGYNMTRGGEGHSGKEVSVETRSKISESIKKIGKEIYTKRNMTLALKDPDFLKTIGRKSSITQKLNETSLGKNNKNFNHNNILLFDGNGNLIKKFLFSEIKELDKTEYPIRMIIECLRTKKRMFRKSLGGNPTNIKYHGWHCCYENELWMEIHNFKNLH